MNLSPSRRLIVAGAVVAGVCVAAGAFGAHGLRGAVTPERLDTWATGAHYGQLHGLAAVVAGMLARMEMARAVRAGWLFVAGAVLFAGSLFALVLLDAPGLGAVAPVGGLAMIGGWGALALGVMRRRGAGG